jgi:osmotically-inducible protein OsmY
MCKSYSLYILFSLIIFQIVGCAPAAVVSAPVTLADRRASEIQYIDQKIEIKAILETQDIDQEDNLSFVSYNQIVLLTGEASSQEIVTKVADKIASLQNVKEIKNFIKVQP